MPQSRAGDQELGWCRYHLIHSVALLGVALVRKPRVTGVLMVGGMATFCGTTYYHAFTGTYRVSSETVYTCSLFVNCASHASLTIKRSIYFFSWIKIDVENGITLKN